MITLKEDKGALVVTIEDSVEATTAVIDHEDAVRLAATVMRLMGVKSITRAGDDVGIVMETFYATRGESAQGKEKQV